MSMTNFITEFLQLKDLNISISKEISYMTKRNVKYTLLSGVLTYLPDVCPVCGSVNENCSIIKHGTKSSDIKLLPCNGNPTYLRLKKQRFLCKECGSTFSAKTDLVDTNCYISKQVKLHIIDNLRLKISEKDIAHMNYVSHSTVFRAVDNCFTEFIPKHQVLPAHLMFDEFKSTKDIKGSMSFIFADATTHMILDIVPNRQLPYLVRYFGSFSREARESVETVCIDIYTPYMTLIKEYFPNAKIIIDRFHIVQLLNRALQKTRVDTMKKYATSSLEYKRLKRYWKLVSKNVTELDSIDFKHRTYFKSWLSEKTLVDQCISIDEKLKNSYEVYQILLNDINKMDKNSFDLHLHRLIQEDISDRLKTAIRTLLKHKAYVLNSLDYSYSNGGIEGLNNYIKVIKRTAFGFRSFVHFRNRILISKNLVIPIKKYQANSDLQSLSA